MVVIEAISWLVGWHAHLVDCLMRCGRRRENVRVAVKKTTRLLALEGIYRDMLEEERAQRAREATAQAPAANYWVGFTLYYRTSQYDVQTEGRGAWVASGSCHDFQMFLDRPALEGSWIHVHGPCSVTQIKVGNSLITGTHSQESSVLGVRIQDPIHLGQRLGVQVRAHATVRDPLDKSPESREVSYCIQQRVSPPADG